MLYEFIDRLDLPPAEKEHLRLLADRGSDTPFKLLGLSKVHPEQLSESAAGQLEVLITDAERAELSREMPNFGTGALLDLPEDLKH
jgi:hypothetical protein